LNSNKASKNGDSTIALLNYGTVLNLLVLI